MSAGRFIYPLNENTGTGTSTYEYYNLQDSVNVTWETFSSNFTNQYLFISYFYSNFSNPNWQPSYNISVPPNGSALFPLYIAETSYEARFEVSGFVDKSQSFSYGTAVFHVEALNGTANPVTWAGTPVQSVPVQPGLIDPEAFSFTTILSATVISTEGLALNTPLSNTVPSTSSSIQSSAIQSTVDLE